MMTRVLVESVVISLLCAFELRVRTFELRVICVWTWLEPFEPRVSCKLWSNNHCNFNLKLNYLLIRWN